MKTLLLIGCAIVFFAWNAQSQNLVKTLQPSTYNYLQAVQQMPDSTARFFVTTQDSKFGSAGKLFLVDQDSNVEFEFEALWDTIPFTPFGDVYEIVPLHLEDGNAILVVNSFQCDIVFTDIVMLNKEGEVQWLIQFESFFSTGYHQLGRVSPNIFAITGDEATYYYDFQGQEILFPPSQKVYYNTVRYNGNYFGTTENAVYKLDIDFDVIESFPADSITYFKHLGQNLFLVESDSGVQLITDNFDVIATNEQIEGVVSASYSNEILWVITESGMQVLDQLLMNVYFHPHEINETMKYTWVYRDTIYVASEYITPNHRDLVIRSYLPDQVFYPLLTDLEISNLYFPDTIERKTWNNLPYAFTYSFESMGVEITNRSEDTLHSCVVNIDWASDVWCIYYIREWKIDNIEVPPHESVIVELGPFETDVLYYAAGPPFCFWVDNPNGRPDLFPSNDMLCGESLILSAGDERESADVLAVYPNPATESIAISGLKENEFCHATIINSLGQQLRLFQGIEPSEYIPVHDLYPGVYHVVLKSEKSGSSFYSSFIKQ